MARSGEFNTAAALALFALMRIGVARADEVHKWRDAEGNLHYSVTGTPDAPAAADDGPRLSSREASAAEKFSTTASLRRGEIERKLRAAGRELEAVREDLQSAEARTFNAWVPAVTANPRTAQASLEAQRDALLAAGQFEREKTDALRRLKHRERDRLKEIVGLWKERDALSAEVRSQYGALPPWWREQLDCQPCPSPEEAEKALRPVVPTPVAGEEETAGKEDDDWGDEESEE